MVILIKRVDEDSAPTCCWCFDEGSGAEVVARLDEIDNYDSSAKTVPALKSALIGHHLSGVVGGSWQLID